MAVTTEEKSLAPPARFGPVEWTIVAAALAFRFALFALGRSPMDGDEGIMGIMAAHMARAERFPIYFYWQHYMGTLEVPLAALLAAPGPPAWMFSVWPIRIAAALYFVFLCWIHFRLSDRFFGARAARWSLLFICVGTFYWIDYSMRLRHVVLMIALGEAMALLALSLVDRWRAGGGVSLRLAFLLGLCAGLAWWHYQLIAVFIAALIPLFIWGRGLFLLPVRRFPSGQGFDPAAAARLGLAVLAAAALARLTLGWLRLSSAGYPATVGAFTCALLLALAWHWRAYRLERPAAQTAEASALAAARFAPAVLLFGFLLGYSPSLVYLVRLNEEFWISQPPATLYRFMDRLRDFIMLDLSALLEITRPAAPNQIYVHAVDARTYANIALYTLAFYALGRAALRGAVGARLGAAWSFALIAALLVLHVVFPRPTDWNSPRFLVPLCVPVAFAFALLAEELETALRSAVPRSPAGASAAAYAAVLAAAIALWLPGWRPLTGQKMSWPSGHRAAAMQILAEFEKRGIEKVDMPRGTEYVLLGYELAFASRLEVRCNRGSLGDRLLGIVDESRYGGTNWFLSLPTYKENPKTGERVILEDDLPPEGFWVDRYYVVKGGRPDLPGDSGSPNLGDLDLPPE